ncbi:hypothetical protein L210DRAFT_3584700 [Boletus edulis BED1]|uniref:Uncharacterized protein n=1 Tax=Boletus edulis BED1 TaxID=1328754 RepID=A0AAD4G5V5_BOLED|nr:hypothetical protein L210DRAFT_3584700 [Boletus edulis BED1]
MRHRAVLWITWPWATNASPPSGMYGQLRWSWYHFTCIHQFDIACIWAVLRGAASGCGCARNKSPKSILSNVM